MVPATRGSRPVVIRHRGGRLRVPLWVRTEYQRPTWSPRALAFIGRLERVKVVHAHDEAAFELASDVARRLRLPLVLSATMSESVPTGVDALLVPTMAHAELARGLGPVVVCPPAMSLSEAETPESEEMTIIVAAEERRAAVAGSLSIDEWSAATARAMLRLQHGGVPVIATQPWQHAFVPPPHRASNVDEGRRMAQQVVDGSSAHTAAREAARQHVVLRHELGAVAADLDEVYRAVAERREIRISPPGARLPTVSVVMSTFNRADLLPAALAALEGQTYPGDLVEFVVVDNGSEDTTPDVLASWQPAQSHRLLRNAVNTTAAEARNRAVRESTGDIVAFTDDDCIAEPTWLESLVSGFREDVGIVQGLTRPMPSSPQGPLTRSQSTPYEYGLYETCNIAYRRSVLPEPDPFSPFMQQSIQRFLGRSIGRQAFGEDVDLAWRVKRAGVGSRFAAEAVVNHHVFPSDPIYIWRRAALVAGFPVLVKRFPELRSVFLSFGLLLGRRRVAVWLAILGLASMIPAVQVALLMPWLWDLLKPRRRGRRGRLKALPALVVRDIIETIALLYGSVRSRALVL